MAPKKKRPSGKFKVGFFNTIPLPQIKGAQKYFQDFCKKIQSNGVELYVQNSRLFLTADSKEMLEVTNGTIQKEIVKFSENNRSVIKKLPRTGTSFLTKRRKKHIKSISNNIIRRSRIRDCQNTKQINHFLRAKRQHWNRIQKAWKQ